jgi:hypothetical protein
MAQANRMVTNVRHVQKKTSAAPQEDVLSPFTTYLFVQDPWRGLSLPQVSGPPHTCEISDVFFSHDSCQCMVPVLLQ